jgi:hypothetical protein
MSEAIKLKRRSVRTDSASSEPEQCPVCYEEFEDERDRKRPRQAQAGKRRREVFPCPSKHAFCTQCSARVDVCPLCRVDRSGKTQEERSARRAQQERGIVLVQIPRESRAATIRFPLPSHSQHPMDPENMRVSGNQDSIGFLISVVLQLQAEARERRGSSGAAAILNAILDGP